jgi:hypothetical protein
MSETQFPTLNSLQSFSTTPRTVIGRGANALWRRSRSRIETMNENDFKPQLLQGFIGIIDPHFARMLVGPDHRILVSDIHSDAHGCQIHANQLPDAGTPFALPAMGAHFAASSTKLPR